MIGQREVRSSSPTAARNDLRTQLLPDMPVNEQRLHLAGISTVVLDGGNGPPIILLHGQGEFAAVWTRVLPALVETHRVIAPDLPGHGASEIGPDALDRDRLLAWLGALVDQACRRPPVIVGHLLGGALAARFAVDHDEQIERLVLVDSLGLAWYRPTLRFTLAMVHFMARPTKKTQDRLFRRCMADLDEVRAGMDGNMELLEAYALDRARGPNVKHALQSLMPRLGVPPISPTDLARIDTPTSLIWGRHDLQVRLSTAEDASARYGWPLHVIEHCADDPAIEQPEAFLKALRTALGTT